MKKQLLTIAMLVSVFAIGNVFAAGEGEDTSSSPETTLQRDGGAGSQSGEDTTQKDPSMFSKCVSGVKFPFTWTWANRKAVTVGAVIATAARLVYDNFDKIMSKSNDDDAEEDEDEDEE